MDSIKGTIIYVVISVMIVAMINSQSVNSQNWEGSRKIGIWERWAVTMNYGYVSYFGDLSRYDKDIRGKLVKESGSGYSMIISKYINNIYGISGQLLAGNMKGTKDNFSFTTELIEYNLQFRINFINLINNSRDHKFGILGYAGIGQFLFTTTSEKNVEEIITTTTYAVKTPEFVVFAGGGVHYIIGSNLSISASLSLRQCQNDRLDGYINHKDNDYYSFLNVGLTYYIPSFANHPLRNRARIANSNFKFTASLH